LTPWVALFRGINVGGANKLSMAELRAVATQLGLAQPCTYIQSGNLVFGYEQTEPDLSAALAAAVKGRFGISTPILLRNADQMAAAIAANPFSEKVSEGKQLHFFFFDGVAEKYDEAALRSLAIETEDFALTGNVLYLFAPDGVGRSKLAENLPRFLPHRYTARNFNSINAIFEMMGGGID
jgi:uncharacterized protein (DUF1697 family)